MSKRRNKPINQQKNQAPNYTRPTLRHRRSGAGASRHALRDLTPARNPYTRLLRDQANEPAARRTRSTSSRAFPAHQGRFLSARAFFPFNYALPAHTRVLHTSSPARERVPMLRVPFLLRAALFLRRARVKKVAGHGCNKAARGKILKAPFPLNLGFPPGAE